MEGADASVLIPGDKDGMDVLNIQKTHVLPETLTKNSSMVRGDWADGNAGGSHREREDGDRHAPKGWGNLASITQLYVASTQESTNETTTYPLDCLPARPAVSAAR
jgi:hypothetical protein